MIQSNAGMLNGAVAMMSSKQPVKSVLHDSNSLASLRIMDRFAGVTVFALRRLISANTSSPTMKIAKVIILTMVVSIRNIYFLITLVVKLPFGVQSRK